MLLVVLSVAADVVASMPGMQELFDGLPAYRAFECLVGVVFTSEYVLRLWSCVDDLEIVGLSDCRCRRQWCCGVFPVVDLVVVLAFYADTLVPEALAAIQSDRQGPR